MSAGRAGGAVFSRWWAGAGWLVRACSLPDGLVGVGVTAERGWIQRVCQMGRALRLASQALRRSSDAVMIVKL